jgi:hypothetical protein
MATFLTLPPHLVETIQNLLHADTELDLDIREPLKQAVEDVQRACIAPIGSLGSASDASKFLPVEDSSEHVDHIAPVKEVMRETADDTCKGEDNPPPIIDIEVLEKLSKWASLDTSQAQLRRSNLGSHGLRHWYLR